MPQTATDHNAKLARLDALLLQDWVPNAAMDLSMLDGFFTAAISSPKDIAFDRALPRVWDVEQGVVEPTFPSREAAEEVLGLLREHWDYVAAMLGQTPEQFDPVFSEGPDGVVIEDWCLGYIAGMQLDPTSWDGLSDELRDVLEPVFLYGTEEGEDLLKELALTPEQRDDIARALPDMALALYDEFHPRP
ncbi:MAG: YecA family protein [Betaproteobacteria bacterium]|nr:YecA family protein [Betaproteobacteria bacterium]